MKKLVFFVCLIIAVFPIFTDALQFDQPLPASLTEQFQNSLDHFTDRFHPGYFHGYSAAVYIDGIGMWIGVSGNAVKGIRTSTDDGYEYPGAITLQPRDLFHIGSLSKHFVSVIVLRLMEEGKLKLDDTLEQWIPGLIVPNAESITIRQLLNHTSGVYDYTNVNGFYETVTADPFHPVTAWDVIELIKNEHPTFIPGQNGKWSYSNTGYTLIHMIVEAVTGKPFAEELHRLVTQPLKLTNTYYGGFEEIPDYPTLGYNADTITSKNMHLSWACGGSIISTAEDVCRFSSTVFGGYFLQPESLIEMISPVENIYGLGVFIHDGNPKVFYHSGEIYGFLSHMLYDVNHGITVVSLQNSDSSDNYITISNKLLTLSQDFVETSVSNWSLY